MEDPKLEFFSLDDVPKNSFILIKVDVAGPMEKYAASSAIAKELQKYQYLFIQKNLTLMVLTPKESISVLTEEEMNQAGWYRK